MPIHPSEMLSHGKLNETGRSALKKMEIPFVGYRGGLLAYSDAEPLAVTFFIEHGYARRMTFAEVVRTQSMAELKKELRKQGLPISGNSAALSSRLLSVYTEEEKRRVSPYHFVLTEKGQNALKEGDADKRTAAVQLVESCVASLLTKRYSRVVQLMNDYNTKFADRNVGDVADNMCIEAISALYSCKFPYFSLDEKDLRVIKSTAIFEWLLGYSSPSNSVQGFLKNLTFLGCVSNEMADLAFNTPALTIVLRTMKNYLSNQCAIQGFKTTRIRQYRVLATLDERTCPICGDLDLRAMDVSKAKVGVNCPPMHAGCRCTVIAVVPGESFEDQPRAARNTVSGDITSVPFISYREWKNRYPEQEKTNAFNESTQNELETRAYE